MGKQKKKDKRKRRLQRRKVRRHASNIDDGTHEVWYYKTHFVCFGCRRGYKRHHNAKAAECPRCKCAMRNMGKGFRVPKRRSPWWSGKRVRGNKL
jgi:hypothetical protein